MLVSRIGTLTSSSSVKTPMSARAGLSCPPPGGVPRQARSRAPAPMSLPSLLRQASENLRPKRDLILVEFVEMLRAASLRRRHVVTELRSTTAGSPSAADSALLSLSIIGFGVPFGAESPNQTVRLNAGMPTSAVVGTSRQHRRTRAARHGVSLELTLFHVLNDVDDLIAAESTMPASMSIVACGVPR
jgi:hypothetical protein